MLFRSRKILSISTLLAMVVGQSCLGESCSSHLSSRSSFQVKSIQFTVLNPPAADSSEEKSLLRLSRDICEAFEDQAFSDFFSLHVAPLTAFIDLNDTPHSFPLTFNADYRSMAELKAILIHEAWAHDVIAKTGNDSQLIEQFKKNFPGLLSQFPNLSVEVLYRHVGVNALEAMALRKIFSPAVYEAYFKPQTKKNKNPLRGPVYEAIYNLVTDPFPTAGKTNLQKITEILRQHSVSIP